MAAVTVETAKFILENIETSTKRLSDLEELIENYKFQISNVGKNSSLGQIFTRDLNLLKGEKNNLVYRIDELKRCIADFDMSLLKSNDKETEQVKTEEYEEEIVEETVEEVEDIKVDEKNAETSEVEEIVEETYENEEATGEEIKEEYEYLDTEDVEEVKQDTITENNDDNCDYYKVSCVAAFRNDKLLDALIIENEKDIDSKILQLYREYGNDIKVMYNSDGYKNNQAEPVVQFIGWKDVKDLYKVKKQETTNTVKEEPVIKTEDKQVNNDSMYTKETVQSNIEDDYYFDDLYDYDKDRKVYNVKVVYSKGKYTISYDFIDDEGEIISKTFEHKLSTRALFSKYYRKTFVEKYNMDMNSNIYNKMDVNLLLCLEEIDKAHGTGFAREYTNESLNIRVKYDLRDKLFGKSVKLEDRMLQRKVALNQRYLANANVEGAYLSKAGVVTAVASFVALATLGISSILPSFGKKDTKVAKNKTNVQKDVAVNTTEEINTTEIVKEIVNNKEKQTKDNTGLGINDSLQLNITDDNGNIKSTFKLSKGLSDKSAKVLASDYSDCDKFKVCAIAVCKDGKNLEIINSKDENSDIKTNALYDKYGNEADIRLNFDAYKEGKETPEYERIGWLSLNDFKNRDSENVIKDIATAQEQIKQENEKNNVTIKEENEVSENKTEVTEEKEDKTEKETNKTETASKEDENIGPGYYDFGLEGKIMLAFRDKDGNVVFSQKLSSDAWGNEPLTDAGKIDCDYFKVSCIAVYSGSDVLDVRAIEDGESVDDLTNYMYQKFGADIDIAYNFDGVNEKNNEYYKYVGWLNLDKIVSITQEEKEAAANYNKDTAKVKVKN